MAERRMLARKTSIDDRLAQLSSNSCLLYLMSIPHLDRDGRMDGLPVAVRGTIVPYRARRHPHQWTDELVESYIVEWTRTLDIDGHQRPLVKWGCIGGVWVLEFLGFAQNQTLRYDREAPSRFPALPDDLLSPIVPRAVAATTDADPDPDPGPDAALGPVGERLFADDRPLRAPAATARAAALGPTPELLRTQAEAEGEGEGEQSSAEPFARAREATPAALPDSDPGKPPAADGPSPGRNLGCEVVAGVERRHAALASHGALARLLEVLPDADANTPGTLHALFDSLGPAAIEHARQEVLAMDPRRPSAYAVGIAKRLAREATVA
jgi:hypothetical protein